MTFTTHGFTRGMFRNLDQQPAKLRIARFAPSPPEARHKADIDRQKAVAQARCDIVATRAVK